MSLKSQVLALVRAGYDKKCAATTADMPHKRLTELLNTNPGFAKYVAYIEDKNAHRPCQCRRVRCKPRQNYSKAVVVRLVRAGLSQAQAAIKAGLQPSQVTHWKRSDKEFKTKLDELRRSR